MEATTSRTYEKPYRSYGASLFNLVGRQLRRWGWSRRLSMKDILDSACRYTGLSDWGDERFQEPLQVLVKVFDEEAQFNPLGRLMMRLNLRHFAANRLLVYLYRFSYVQTGMRQMLRAGTPHGGEIGFVFGTLGAGGFGPPPPATDEDRAVSNMAQGYWVNFAKTGDPNGAGLPPWPRYDPSKDLIFEFHPDGSAGAIPDPWKPRLDVMQKATESGKRAD